MKYQDFHTKYGIRTLQMLRTPRIWSSADFELPLESVVQHIPLDDVSSGIKPSDMLLTDQENDIVLHHQMEYPTMDGIVAPRKTPGNPEQLVKEYHKRYRGLRLIRKLTGAYRDKRTVVVHNHAMLQHLWRFQRSIARDWNVSQLTIKSLVDGIRTSDGLGTRQQFIEVLLPTSLPAREAMDLVTKTERRGNEYYETYKSLETCLLLEIFKFTALRPSAFDALTEHQLKRTNLVYSESGQWSILNLGDLKEWSGEDDISKEFYMFLDQMFARRIEEDPLTSEPSDSETVAVDTEPASTDPVEMRIHELVKHGRLTPPEATRFRKMHRQSQNISNPFGEGTLHELAGSAPPIAPELETMPDSPHVLDKNMLRSSISKVDRAYLEKGYERDLGMVMQNLNRGGVIVNKVQALPQVDVLSKTTDYRLTVTPVGGAQSTIHFKLPTIQADGTFTVDGVKKYMAKQRADIPIRKVSSSRVALTSYTNKTFIARVDKVKNDYVQWLVKHITRSLTDDQSPVKGLALGRWSDTSLELPRVYSGIAMRVTEFKVDSNTFYFNYPDRFDRLKVDPKIESTGRTLIGKQGSKPLTITKEGVVWLEDTQPVELGPLESLIGLAGHKVPVDSVEVRVFNKTIPVGMALAYHLGLERFLSKYRVKHRRVPVGTRLSLEPTDYAIKFSDFTIIMSRLDQVDSLLMAGWNDYHASLKDYHMHDFNSPAVYMNVFQQRDIGLRYLKEISILMTWWVDPVTLDLLKEMKEPETFEGLLYRSIELLTTDQTPDEADTRYQRLRGMERLPGLVHAELVNSIRTYEAGPKNRDSKITMNPQAVWMGVVNDPSVRLSEESTPIVNLREKELVTYLGTNGRTNQSMSIGARRYTKHDRGIISESNVDNGSVGVNAYLSADPAITGLRGLPNEGDMDNMVQLLSTSSVLAPMSIHDDPKRMKYLSCTESSLMRAIAFEELF